jgi:hypothetical protein
MPAIHSDFSAGWILSFLLAYRCHRPNALPNAILGERANRLAQCIAGSPEHGYQVNQGADCQRPPTGAA